MALPTKAGCGPRADRATVDAEAHRQTLACTAGSVLNAPPALAGTLAWRRSWMGLSIPTATGVTSDKAQYSEPLPAGWRGGVEQTLEHAEFDRGPGEDPAENDPAQVGEQRPGPSWLALASHHQSEVDGAE